MSATDSQVVSVVLATYEAPEVLETTLRALADQVGAEDFEIVVADDGSGEAIAGVVERWRARLDLKHVWQPDDGFRKARALNLAALAAKGDYLAFLDADCVPRRGFIRAIRRGALPGWFLSTKRIDLGRKLSRRVAEDGLPIWRWSAAEWLVRAPREIPRPGYLVHARDRRRPWRSGQPEFTPPWFAYCFVGVHRKDFEAANGYDARCRRTGDGEDQDIAIRLRRSGLRCGWSGPASTVLHLWHAPRAYRTDDHVPVFRETEAGVRTRAVQGLRELRAELGAEPGGQESA